MQPACGACCGKVVGCLTRGGTSVCLEWLPPSQHVWPTPEVGQTSKPARFLSNAESDAEMKCKRNPFPLSRLHDSS